MTRLRIVVLCFFASCMLHKASAHAELPEALKLWYKQPATEWAEALPIGKARFTRQVFASHPDQAIVVRLDRLADPAGDGHPGLRSDLWPGASAEKEITRR